MFTWVLFKLSWTLSFIVIMITASRFHIQRLPVFFIYLGKIVLTIIELIWYQRIFDMIERLNWSHDFRVGREMKVHSYYETLNLYPSLLWGCWRGITMSLLGVVLTVVGFKAAGARWAQWAGTMTLIEIVLRTGAHILWKKGTETRLGLKFRILVKHRWWPSLLATRSRARRRDINIEEERVPYSESSPAAPPGGPRTFPGLRFGIWLASQFGLEYSTVVNLDLTRGQLFPRGETWRPAGTEPDEAYVNGNLEELHCIRLCFEVAFGTFLTILVVINIIVGVIVVTSWGCCRLLVQYLTGRFRLLFEPS